MRRDGEEEEEDVLGDGDECQVCDLEKPLWEFGSEDCPAASADRKTS